MSVKLVADGGEITVGARVAVYTYGAFNVVLPEGKELAQDEYLDDGYKDGYVYRPKGVERLGRFDIAFARADVTIDTNAGYSNLEATVDNVQRKVSEDVYFERDITGAGLGGWTPGEDYRVGDIVDVRVFNRIIPQPVTAITYTSTAEDPLGVRVHVGGQTIRDSDLVEEQNRAVREAIAKESATRRAQNRQTSALASAARSDAVAARREAAGAVDAAGRAVVDTVVEFAAGVSRSEAPSSGWSRAYPGDASGPVWQRTVSWFGDGRVERSEPGLMTGPPGADGAVGPRGPQGVRGATGATGPRGPQGPKGDPGKDGVPGKAGVGVRDSMVTYAASASGVSAPSSGWSSQPPASVPAGHFVWTKLTLRYTDNTVEDVFTVGKSGERGPQGAPGAKGATGATGVQGPRGPQGAKGDTGSDGRPGKDGTKLLRTDLAYAVSSSGTQAPSSGWGAQPPAAKPGQFVWTRFVWHYSDKSSETGYSVGKIGQTGATGAVGPRGPQGARGATGAKGATGAQGPRGEAPTIGATSYTFPTRKAELRIGGIVVDTQNGRGHAVWVVDPATGKIMHKQIINTYDLSDEAFGFAIEDVFYPRDAASDHRGKVMIVAAADAIRNGLYVNNYLGLLNVDVAEATGRIPLVVVGEIPKNPDLARTGGKGFIRTGAPGDGQVLTLEVPFTTAGLVLNGAKGDTGDQGQRGPQGPKGDKGATGAQGVSIRSVTHFWRWAGSRPATPTGTGTPSGWATSQPAYVVGQKLWVTIRTLFSNNSVSWSTPTEEASVSAATAIAAESANTKNRVWYAASAPGNTRGEREGDTWFQYSGNAIVGQWRWTGRSWAKQELGHQVIGSIDAAKITTGTLDARRIGAGSITADKIQADSLTVRELRAEVFHQVGADAVPIKPGTTEPAWWDQADATQQRWVKYVGQHSAKGAEWIPEYHLVNKGTAGAFPVQMKLFSATKQPVHYNLVTVDPNQEYDLSFFAQGHVGGRFFIECRDQDGAHAVKSGGINRKDVWASQTDTRYLANNLETDGAFRFYKTRIRFHEKVRAVRIATIYGNHPNGKKGEGVWIGDIKITPHQVDQAQVDALQDKQIKDNEAYTKLVDRRAARALFVAKPNLINGAQFSSENNHATLSVTYIENIDAMRVELKAKGGWTGNALLTVSSQHEEFFRITEGAIESLLEHSPRHVTIAKKSTAKQWSVDVPSGYFRTGRMLIFPD